MVDLTFDEVLAAAHKLSETEKSALISSLQSENNPQPTREQILAMHAALRAAGAFENVESLYGKFANPAVPSVSSETLNETLHTIATEWEQELDEFFIL